MSHHFARIRVEAISLDPRHTSQFGSETMLGAAELLADAGVDAIVWNGTSGGWNGLDSDREICALITERTGIAATTTTLAQLELLERLGLHRVGLALPYTDDVATRIAGVMAGAGLEITAVAGLGVSDNRSMAHVGESVIRSLVDQVSRDGAECVLVYCTGLAAAHLVPRLESELGMPVHDSVAVTLWKGLEMVGIEPRLPGWGSLFAPADTPLRPMGAIADES